MFNRQNFETGVTAALKLFRIYCDHIVDTLGDGTVFETPDDVPQHIVDIMRQQLRDGLFEIEADDTIYVTDVQNAILAMQVFLGEIMRQIDIRAREQLAARLGVGETFLADIDKLIEETREAPDDGSASE